MMVLAILQLTMAAVTAALGRLAKRDPAGNLITGTESEGVGLSEWDNSDAPRPVFYNRFGGREAASPDDSPVPYNVAIRGTEGEVLAFQVMPDATFDADQADNALTRFNILEIIYDSKNRVKSSHTRTLRNSDRITPAGGAGLTHRLGLADGGEIQAGVYTDYLRFAPAENAEWVPIGRQRTDVHDDV